MKRLLSGLDPEGQAILDLVPGGIMQCKNDGQYGIVEVNEGFLTMFGFSREEITERFEDQYCNMIHPSDRQRFLTEIDRQLKKGDTVSWSHRVLCKDGSFKWTASSARRFGDGDEERFFCILLDITEVQDVQEKLSLSLEHLDIIMNQSSDVVFEWDVLSDSIFFSPNWLEKFGYPPHFEGRKEETFSHLHPDDVDSMALFMKEIREGVSVATSDLRIRNVKEEYIWCRIRATSQYSVEGEPLRAVGTISDINEEKKALEILRKRAELDALTGLYNHTEMENRTIHYLEDNPETMSALFIIDVDNFKRVNDGQGHLFGDAVLTELAASMRKLTRKTDVVGRIGGDEFAMFLMDIPSVEFAEAKARALLEMFQHLFHGEKHPIEVTCSVGVALYPNDGGDYKTLFHSADLALYLAKSQGKNQYARFDSERIGALDRSGSSSLGAAIDSNQRTRGEEGNLVNYVFQILYDSTDISVAIQTILEIVGRRFEVSRVYIFENSEDGKYTSNTYEWCGEGIEPQREMLQNFAYAEVDSYNELFRDNAIFYCRDIHSLAPNQAALFEQQGIFSTLQCALYDEKEFRGFIGFDECTGLRMWTKDEIDMLSLIAQLLTTFLLKKREVDRNQQAMSQLNTILDTQNAYIYVITLDTYELLYLNQKTLELDPSAQIGMTCYQAFFGRSTPCESCSLAGAEEMYNPKYGVWTKVETSLIKWGDHSAHLIYCFDISKYKQMPGSGECGGTEV